MELKFQVVLKNKRTCHFKNGVPFIEYTRDTWSEVKAFCRPFSLQKTSRGQEQGRAIIDLPAGNDFIYYGTVLVRLGKQRILILPKWEFEEIFDIDTKNEGYHE